MTLSTDNGTRLRHQEINLRYFPQPIEDTKVRLTHSIGKLCEADECPVQADRGYILSSTKC